MVVFFGILLMDFREVVVRRRSVRKLKEDAVPAESLNAVLDAGRWAPSAGNSQPWHFIVVKDAVVKEKIADACTLASKKAWSRFSPERAKYLAQRGGTWGKSYMKRVPVLMGVCCMVPDGMREELATASAWMAIENMLLAATNVGLGSCVYTTYDVEEENALKDILRVPEEYRLAAIIQLGYASAEPPSSSGRGLEEIVSYEHF
jgi:nitroreductase